MKKLTRKEEELMHIIWNAKQGFVKDFVEMYPDPKPHYNTISSMVRLLQDKGFIGHKEYGNTHEYFPLLSKDEYRKTFMKRVIRDYFDNSYKNVVSYFVEEEKLNAKEIEELLNLIRNKSK